MSPEHIADDVRCICSPVYVGMKESGARNLNPDCPVHGWPQWRCQAAEFNEAGDTVWECDRTDTTRYVIDGFEDDALDLCPLHILWATQSDGGGA